MDTTPYLTMRIGFLHTDRGFQCILLEGVEMAEKMLQQRSALVHVWYCNVVDIFNMQCYTLGHWVLTWVHVQCMTWKHPTKFATDTCTSWTNKVNKAISSKSYFVSVSQGSQHCFSMFIKACTDCTVCKGSWVHVTKSLQRFLTTWVNSGLRKLLYQSHKLHAMFFRWCTVCTCMWPECLCSFLSPCSSIELPTLFAYEMHSGYFYMYQVTCHFTVLCIVFLRPHYVNLAKQRNEIANLSLSTMTQRMQHNTTQSTVSHCLPRPRAGCPAYTVGYTLVWMAAKWCWWAWGWVYHVHV